MGVAEKTRWGMTHEFFWYPSVRVGVVAQRPQILLTEETVTAGNGKGNDNAIAYLDILDSTA